MTRALAELYPDDPPRFLARTPHGYCDRSTIHAHLLAAGFRDVVIDSLDGVSKAASPLDPAVAYCQGTPLRTEIEARGGNLDDATRYASQALAKRFGTGTIAGRIRALVIVAG